ncbi:MAG TPA: terminase [Terriglobales bacterium]|nr:terminase [Terriglobales bacterium]
MKKGLVVEVAVPQSIYRFLEEVQANEKDNLAVLAVLGKYLDLEIRKNLSVRVLLMASLLKIRDKKGELVPFVPNKAQKKIAENWGQHNIILKARQLGMSTYVAARFFIDTITRPGSLTVQVAHDQRAAESIFRIVHRFQENLPEALRNGVLKTSRANMRQLVWPALDSEYRVETAGDANAGRGCTIRNLHCSEMAMWPRDGAEAMASLRAAVPPGGQIVMESTPNGAGGGFYDEWQRAEETGFVRHFLPWFLEDAYRIPGVAAGEVSEEEQALIEKHGLDDEQIVYRRILRANNGVKTPQEYAEDPESCFLASGDCVFDTDSIQKRLKELEPSAMAERKMMRKPPVTEFLPPRPGKKYVIGVDPAGGGVKGDYACAEVIEQSTGLQCAELHGHFTPRELAIKIAELGKSYNQARLVVERNSMGMAVEHSLRDVAHYDNFEGFTTTAGNRPGMIENLSNMLISDTHLFASPALLRECRTFVRQSDGSARASNGSHDDTVMAMAIAQYNRRGRAGVHN